MDVVDSHFVSRVDVADPRFPSRVDVDDPHHDLQCNVNQPMAIQDDTSTGRVFFPSKALPTTCSNANVQVVSTPASDGSCSRVSSNSMRSGKDDVSNDSPFHIKAPDTLILTISDDDDDGRGLVVWSCCFGGSENSGQRVASDDADANNNMMMRRESKRWGEKRNSRKVHPPKPHFECLQCSCCSLCKATW